jgi:hypothetical protein
MNRQAFAAMVLGAFVGAGGVWAQEPAQPALPERTAEGVAADIQAVEAEQKDLARKESEILDSLRAQAPLSTNMLATAGGDEKLAAKMRKIQDLQEQLSALKADVRTEMAASPVLQERRASLEKRRRQLMEIQDARQKLETRKKNLLAEQEAVKK